MISLPTSSHGRKNPSFGQMRLPVRSSPSFGKTSNLIDAEILQARQKLTTTLTPLDVKANVGESLYDALASYKVYTSQVAMYLDINQRNNLFAQLDSLLDEEE